MVSNPIKNKTKTLAYNNPIIVAADVKKLGIEEAIENYGKTDVITAIIDNNNLKHLRPLLATIIKSYDKNSIKEIFYDEEMHTKVNFMSKKDFLNQLLLEINFLIV